MVARAIQTIRRKVHRLTGHPVVVLAASLFLGLPLSVWAAYATFGAVPKGIEENVFWLLVFKFKAVLIIICGALGIYSAALRFVTWKNQRAKQQQREEAR